MEPQSDRRATRKDIKQASRFIVDRYGGRVKMSEC